MTSSHIFFIPAVLLVGAIGGYILGRRMLLAEQAEQRAAWERREARRSARERAAEGAAEPSDEGR